ncbi:MAG: hypothetical protein KDC10_14240 [Calditrichaeota bacterium]|nr:hypothetical protein [Calditrichota bacterium]
MPLCSRYRTLHTFNEQRQFAATVCNDLELPIRVRGRRRPWHLPSSFDDFYRERRRNWKNYRRQQRKMSPRA